VGFLLLLGVGLPRPSTNVENRLTISISRPRLRLLRLLAVRVGPPMTGALVKSRPLLGIPLLTDIAKVASTARAARSGSSTLITTARVAETM
jgi:hypothetical protein